MPWAPQLHHLARNWWHEELIVAVQNLRHTFEESPLAGRPAGFDSHRRWQERLRDGIWRDPVESPSSERAGCVASDPGANRPARDTFEPCFPTFEVTYNKVQSVSSYPFLAEVLAEKYDVEAQAISPDATMAELGLDSLTLIELLFDLEDEFGIEFPEERATFSTLGEAAAVIDDLVRAKEPTG